MSGLYTIQNDTLTLHQHPGQLRAWDSQKRIIAVLAGTQGGKTSWLPLWLWREIARTADPAGDDNDYLAVTATYDLFKLKFLPSLRTVFEDIFKCGRYWASNRVIELRDPVNGYWASRADDRMWGRIILRSAESGGGLESATARGAICDEAGQEAFSIATWEAIRRRVALRQGRVCLGTTVYDLGWLKTELYDPWEKAKGQHPEIQIVQFDSTENPAFPRDEYARAEREMPRWKFDMFYRGRFSRPAGLIYDVFNRAAHICPAFKFAEKSDALWQRYLGLDFGGTNTAGIFIAEEPGTTRLYVYREYHEGGKTASGHAEAMMRGEPMIPFCVGGSKSEGQWRREFRMGGLPVNEPDVSAVEIGIDRVYGAFKRGEIIIFDTCTELIAELESYSREVDSEGNVEEEIKDKSKYHMLDALRYIVGRIRRGV